MLSSRVHGLLFTGVLATAPLAAGGCGDDLPSESLDSGTSGTSGTSGAVDEVYDFAQLEIIEPESATIHWLGEPVHLLAKVTDPDGVSLDVDDVAWVDDDDERTLLDALEGEVELAAGVYDLGAVAHLPNGDRLRTTVGGVRVQARWTGEYDGELVLVVEASFPGGSPLTLQCEGPLHFVVSLDGRDAPVDDGACTISVLGQSFEGAYETEMVIYPAGLVRGTVSFAFDTPLGAFDLPIEWAGAFYDDRFSAGLSSTIDLPLIGTAEASGSLQATLVDRYIDPEG